MKSAIVLLVLWILGAGAFQVVFIHSTSLDEIWRAWYEDAVITSSLLNRPKSFLNAYIPLHLAESCSEALMRASEEYAEADYFVLIPRDTWPVKTSTYIWGQVRVDHRPRLNLEEGFCFSAFDRKSVKMVELARSQAANVSERTIWYDFLVMLASQKGDISSMKVTTIQDHANKVQALQGMNNILIERTSELGFTDRVWTRAAIDKKLSLAVISRNVGTRYSNRLNYGLVKHLHERKRVWLARWTRDVEVVGCQMSELDYYTYWVRIGGGDGSYSDETATDRLTRYLETPDRLLATCSLFTAISQILLLKPNNYDTEKGLWPVSDSKWFFLPGGSSIQKVAPDITQ